MSEDKPPTSSEETKKTTNTTSDQTATEAAAAAAVTEAGENLDTAELPQSDSNEITSTEPKSPKKDGAAEIIRLSTSRGRRGSSSFLTTDDQVVISFDKGRRLSSICTASSYDQDTQISFNEDATEEEISETIRHHKNIIANMKEQHIPMSRKLRVLHRSKAFIKRHEGELKQSKQAKDLVAKYSVYMERSINRLKRELANLIVVITPWEMRIKKIESHFGSGVASYFIFLRWVFWVNLFISVFICCFLMVPEILRGDKDLTGMRKEMESDDDTLSLSAIWEFEGYLKYSPIFYGYYSKTEMTTEGYRLPLAYFLTSLCLYMFSFFCVLRKMAQNARMSRVGSKDDESAFCFKIFTGWDYMIGNSETAYNKVASLVMSLKESILEEKERKKEKTSWKRICLLIFTNLCVLALLASSAYAVVLVVERSQEIENNKIENPSWLRANENTLVVAGISNIYPNIFDFIGSLENYHPRIALRWQLGRILVLNFLNLYTLMLSLFDKVDKKTAELRLIKGNISLTRQQLDIVALSTTATFRVKRDGREEYADYEDGDDSTLFPPAIIYDPYEVAVNSNNNNRDEQSMEGRDRFDDSQNFPDGGSTTSPPWMSTTFTSFSGGGGGGSGSGPGGQRFSASNRSTSSTSSGVHHTSNTAVTSGEHNRSVAAASAAGSMVTLTTQWFSSNDNGSSSTRKPPKRPTTKPRTRLKAGQITTTTEMVTESLLLATEPNLGSCENVTEYQITDKDLMALNATVKDRLRKLCWETMFGQELIKLTVMDLVVLIASTLVGDFFRALIVRYCNGCTCICWDLEKKWPGYGDFKIAENILHLVNNQGMIWLGMFFSPGLPALNTVKLCLLMYFRSWALLTCNIPHETVFKASRNNNFYFILLLFMLFLCTLPVSYAVVWLEPSWHCGPFSDYARIYKILSNYVSSKLNSTFNKVLDYLTSPGAVLPLLLLMVLFIYYLLSTVSSMKEANRELKSQLRKDKDVSEANNLGLELGIGPNVQVSSPNAKHVRIQESDPKSADKVHLLESTSDTSVVSG